jgi:Biotin carboxylase, N-terminal domain/Carbamoyl-phosphate synthase L chain, ATP binding domain
MPEEPPAAPGPFRKLLVANRSEIAIRVFRTATELSVHTVAIYSHEDRFALHRFKADEAYRVGNPGEPIRAYLDIPAIVAIAKRSGADAIHPGYGFLSENPAFARAVRAAGLIFVGPRSEILDQLGDKVVARRIAAAAGVPVLPGTDSAVRTDDEARRLAAGLGYPVIVKAAMGGGGRGMPSTRPGARRALPSASPTSSSRSTFPEPDTSRCSFWATRTKVLSTFSSAIARCNAGIKRSLKLPQRRHSMRTCGDAFSTPPWPSGAWFASITRAQWSFLSTTIAGRSTSSKLTRASKSNTRSLKK